MQAQADSSPSCPLPIADYAQVLMAHGGGGRLMQQLLARVFYPAFDNAILAQRHDGAVLDLGGSRIAFTTDSYVIHPLFFPGGDIGTLAVCGTVNDLAMCGARPRWLSAGFIIEEGLPIATLEKVVTSMKATAESVGVQLVTGDTKVVEKGKGDGLFINTAGIGLIMHERCIGPDQVRAGDAVLLSGDIGRHGLAVMSVREGLAFESPIASDCAPLATPVQALLDAGLEVHCLRDLTRGGLAAALNEISDASHTLLEIEETTIPISPEVRGASEILGLDPLYVANEGTFIAFLPAAQVEPALEVARSVPGSTGMVRIGTVATGPARVTLRNQLGARRVIDLLSGEQLPRIC